MVNSNPSFANDGAELHRKRVSVEDVGRLRTLADRLVSGRAGARVYANPLVASMLAVEGALGRLATDVLGPTSRAVRAVMFDKTAERNWQVAWHQDRTIAVRERREVPGFGPWSVKGGVVHVEPPADITANMITLRLHLDPCGDDNAPLLIAPGSHWLGRIPAAEIDQVVSRLGEVACLAEPGDVWLYSTAIVHASRAALHPIRRRVLQVDYAGNDLPCGLEWLGIESGISD
jgi:hypothetical protein